MPRPEPGAGTGKQHGAFGADFFERHLSKMMLAPSFPGVSAPPMQKDGSNLGAIPEAFGAQVRMTESEASTQSGIGLQVERTGSASTAGDAVGPTVSGMGTYNDPVGSYRASDMTPPMGTSVSNSSSYKVGDHIEVWSKTHQTWCRGIVEGLEDGGLVNLKYSVPDGSSMTKLMPVSHEHVRRAVPSAPDYRQDHCQHSYRQDHFQHSYQEPRSPTRSYANSRGAPPPPPPPFERMQPELSMADSRHPGEGEYGPSVYASPMASYQMQSMAGNQAPSCMASQQEPMRSSAERQHQSQHQSQQMQAWQQDASAGPPMIDVHARAASASHAPPTPGTPMVLCGLPIKSDACAVHKPKVASKHDRCCRCAMPVGESYFDYTCPKCTAVVCQHCLEDLKCVINSYRCPSCGDPQSNEETLKQTLWNLKMYRSAQRAVSAVPTLVAGLFGSGPEAAKAGLEPVEERMEDFPPVPSPMTAEPVQPQPAAPSAPRGSPEQVAAPVAAAPTQVVQEQVQSAIDGRVFTNSFATFWGAGGSQVAGSQLPPKRKGKAADPGKTLLDEYKAGDPIEVWSNSCQNWLRGFVEKVDDGMVSVKYFTSTGQAITKLLPDGHADLRHAPSGTRHATTAQMTDATKNAASGTQLVSNQKATGTALVCNPKHTPGTATPVSKPGPPAGAAVATGTPDYQTQPPVGWFEGAGCGADPAAIAMVQAASSGQAPVARTRAAPAHAATPGLQPPDLYRGLATVQHQQKPPQQHQQQRPRTPDRRAPQQARPAPTSPMGADAFQTRLPGDQVRSPMR